MQLAYMLSMFVVIMAFAFVGLTRSSDPVQDESLATIQQMSAWHKAAIRLCAKTPCNTGTVNPTSQLPTVIKDGTINYATKFKTRYDSTAKILVTYLDESALRPVGPTLGTISAALAKEFGGDQTVSAGQFDAKTDEITPNYVPGYAVGAVITVPSSIAGSIKDGAPVIGTRM
jgi:hypothetical protein